MGYTNHLREGIGFHSPSRAKSKSSYDRYVSETYRFKFFVSYIPKKDKILGRFYSNNGRIIQCLLKYEWYAY